jgi:uncharacterized protein (TIGR03118 family)
LKASGLYTHIRDLGGRAVVALAPALLLARSSAALGGYEKLDLVSDQSGVASFSDPHLVNAWGLGFTPTGLVFVADNGTGVSTLYAPSGIPIPIAIHIPSPSSQTGSAAPSGLIFNPTSSFIITHGDHSRPARFLYATENGTIAGWNPLVAPANAVLAVDNSSHGVVYKGIAWSHTTYGDWLYATDFHHRRIDVFDGMFMPVHIPGAFMDPNLPVDYSPFGIRAIGGEIFVTYAKLLPPENHDDEAGPGHGFIDVYHPDGTLVRRLVSHGALNSPWGLALAPANFGELSSALLVGNFGDGTINAYRIGDGAFLGALSDGNGHRIVTQGLWGLDFAVSPQADQEPRLYFTAGPDGETHGLLGFIHALPSTHP